MQKLPIGEQEFTLYEQHNELYVNKPSYLRTDARWSFIYLLLSRPRRFGKSLLVTTLAEIYRGNRALFQGLWIEDKLDWQPHPVILINFNGMDYRGTVFSDALSQYIDK